MWRVCRNDVQVPGKVQEQNTATEFESGQSHCLARSVMATHLPVGNTEK